MFNTLPPLNGGTFWCVGTAYLCYLGNEGDGFIDSRKRFDKATCEVRFKAVTWTTSNVKVLPTTGYWGKRPIDNPAQGNFYNRSPFYNNIEEVPQVYDTNVVC